MGSKLTSYYFNLGNRIEEVNGVTKILWHVTSKDLRAGRISYPNWKNLIQRLKSRFSHRLNFELYAKPEGTQHVYEYRCDLSDLKYVIKDFIIRELNGEVVIDTFEYNKDQDFFNLHPEIATSYRPSQGSPYL